MHTRASTHDGSNRHVIHGWPVLPYGESLGAVTGVGVDSDDHVFVFHRAGRSWPDSDVLDVRPIQQPTVVIFDGTTGVELKSWGAGEFAMPHGLTIDQKDNVWLTDVALQQVFKFSHDGQLLFALGERGVAGDDTAHFNRPTKVAVAVDESFYVSDGYRNARIMKFSPDGKFISQWGSKGARPGEFDLPHAVSVDAAGRVYVADRNNARVQIFDADGRFLEQWKGAALGCPYDLAIGPDGTVFIADGGDQPEAPPHRSALVVVNANGSVVERVGRWGNYDGQFCMAHGVAVGKRGAVYVGDTDGKRVQKFL